MVDRMMERYLARRKVRSRLRRQAWEIAALQFDVEVLMGRAKSARRSYDELYAATPIDIRALGLESEPLKMMG